MRAFKRYEKSPWVFGIGICQLSCVCSGQMLDFVAECSVVLMFMCMHIVHIDAAAATTHAKGLHFSDVYYKESSCRLLELCGRG